MTETEYAIIAGYLNAFEYWYHKNYPNGGCPTVIQTDKFLFQNFHPTNGPIPMVKEYDLKFRKELEEVQ